MTFSRISLATCFVALSGGTVVACAAVIDIGDPALASSEEAAAAPIEASTPRDASTAPQDAEAADSTPPMEAGVACGSPTKLCSGATPVCCTYHLMSGGYKYACAATCAPPNSTEDYLASLKCSRFSDCPGERCCLGFGSNSASSTCKATCAAGEYLLCDEPPAANTCPAGYDACKAFSTGFPAAFGYCRKTF